MIKSVYISLHSFTLLTAVGVVGSKSISGWMGVLKSFSRTRWVWAKFLGGWRIPFHMARGTGTLTVLRSLLGVLVKQLFADLTIFSLHVLFSI